MKAYIAVFATGIVVGSSAGWFLWRSKPVPVMTYAPEVKQNDGSVVIERKPVTEAPKRPHVIPKGYVVERAVSVTVEPTNTDVVKPITVDLSLVKGPDGSRVIASSPDGDVIGNFDMPVGPPSPFVSYKWAVGVIYSPTHDSWGAFVDQDLGPIRLGAEMIKVRHATGMREYQVNFKAGVRF